MIHVEHLTEGLKKYHDELYQAERLTIDCTPYKKQEEVEEFLRLMATHRPKNSINFVVGANFNICKKALENITSFQRQSFETWEEFKETRQKIESEWGAKRSIVYILNQHGITNLKDIPRKNMLRAIRKDDRFFLAAMKPWITFIKTHHPCLRPFQFINGKTYDITHRDDNVFAISHEDEWRFTYTGPEEFLTALLGDYLNVSRCSTIHFTGDVTQPLLNTLREKGLHVVENSSTTTNVVTVTKKRKGIIPPPPDNILSKKPKVEEEE